MKKVIYLSGPIGDVLADNEELLKERRREFNKYTRRIQKVGCDVINPFTISDKMFERCGNSRELITRKDLMREDIHQLVSYADEVWLMPGWEESRGCDGEVHAALACGIPVFDIERCKVITLSKTGMQALLRPLCGRIATDVPKIKMYATHKPQE